MGAAQSAKVEASILSKVQKLKTNREGRQSVIEEFHCAGDGRPVVATADPQVAAAAARRRAARPAAHRHAARGDAVPPGAAVAVRLALDRVPRRRGAAARGAEVLLLRRARCSRPSSCRATAPEERLEARTRPVLRAGRDRRAAAPSAPSATRRPTARRWRRRWRRSRWAAAERAPAARRPPSTRSPSAPSASSSRRRRCSWSSAGTRTGSCDCARPTLQALLLECELPSSASCSSSPPRRRAAMVAPPLRRRRQGPAAAAAARNFVE